MRAVADKRLQEKRGAVSRLASSCGAHNVRVFGSVARGDARPDSDIDLLVDMEPGRSLLDLGNLLLDLQQLLGYEVDAVTEKSLHWYIRDKVLQEAVPLLRTTNST